MPCVGENASNGPAGRLHFGGILHWYLAIKEVLSLDQEFNNDTIMEISYVKRAEKFSTHFLLSGFAIHRFIPRIWQIILSE